MKNKNTIPVSFLLIIVLATITYFYINKEQPVSYIVKSNTEKCKKGYIMTTIVTLKGNVYTCDLASSLLQGPRLIGSGNEIYSLTGYYHEYKREFLFFDNELPSLITCQGFLVTKGDQGFISAFKEKIGESEESSGNIIINLNDMMIGNVPIRILDASSSLSSSIKESSLNKQITLNFKVFPFPERDSAPCDNHGINIVTE